MFGEINNAAIAIVAPYPSPQRIQEGWTSRIAAIDHAFSGLCRIYLNFAEHHDDSAVEILWRDEDTAEVLVNPQGRRSAHLITRLCTVVRLLYVHTLHMADYILPWLDTGKVCVDIHGVTPEEEEMLGRAYLKAHYERVEEKVLRQALNCIAVSNAMIEHYTQKYPEISPNWITIPVFENTWADNPEVCSRFNMTERSQEELPVAVVYAGGTQAWQNVDGMLELVKCTSHWAKYDFYSHDQRLIKKSAREMNITVRATFCEKERLPSIYNTADFGLILRDDTAVNRVACPTKLSEYLSFGVIPIVRSPRLGDFPQKGYKFVLESDFKAGFFPDKASREWMIKRNLQVIHSIGDDFNAGTSILRGIAFGYTSVDDAIHWPRLFVPTFSD